MWSTCQHVIRMLESFAETERRVARDPREHGVARQKNAVAVESALRDVGVRDGHYHTLARQFSTQVADANPVIERRSVHRRVLKQLADHDSLMRACPADQFGHN